ncbi:MAG TPA: HAMP domain-containing sensor histidine kinase [Frateuria sp.]|uniref:sensor histidine kinase n=1 Tax=Frateuria sp. TaxID=2211372 RepID=UPI002DE74587|nr:HAMP domain-containing sensor histidine kinase [Frateuria sp.]
MDRGLTQGHAEVRGPAGAFHRRLALIFGLHLLGVLICVMLGWFSVAPLAAVFVLIVVISVLAWLAARRQWRPVGRLARVIDAWDERPDLDALAPSRLSGGADADVVSLARGLHGFATRIAGYNLRERNFTRDASHELRSPLTVIKMSADMLSDESELSKFGVRSVKRIQRATREMEALIEALLILARESDVGAGEEEFVVNDVLSKSLDDLRQLLEGRSIDLELEEPARFALRASPRVFMVLCWQLIRNASQQADHGTIRITVLPGAIAVSNRVDAAPAIDRHGFELAIAQRISERFHWPLELQTRDSTEHIARISFPDTLPA